MIGVGDVPGCMDGADPTPYLSEYGASILRVIVSPTYGADGSALPCIQAAVDAGFKVHLVIQYWNYFTIEQDVAFFQHVLGYYAASVWAVSVGNEQEGMGGASPAGYAAVWHAVEPVVAQLAPQAIRVAGEVTPWGVPFIQAAYAIGLPGVQAIAAHPYDTDYCFTISTFLAWTRAIGLQAWFTEGLAGPGAFGYHDGVDSSAGDRPLWQMAGAAVADAWLG